MFEDKVSMQGFIGFVHRDGEGRLKEERHIKNTVTSGGKALPALLLFGSGVAVDFLAIGTGSPAGSALGGELAGVGGSRRGTADVGATATTITLTNDAAVFTTTFTFSGTAAVTEAGLFNSASAGVMICSQSFAALNVISADTLAITWKVQFT